MEIDNLKICRQCLNPYPATVECFGFSRMNGRQYLRSYCKRCQTIRHNEWAKNNPETNRQIAKRSYDKHRELRIAKEVERDRRLRNDPITGPIRRAQNNAFKAKWRKANIEHARQHDREYAKTKNGSARYARRRARKAGAPGEYNRTDLLEIASRQDDKCFWCAVDISQNLVADHYIPLSRGGTNWPSNIVASCPSCNSRKRNKLPEEFKKELCNGTLFRMLS
jgi:5-methylcytosine-specific restriction endonuclease McrA